jgi:galactose mutarotase-like enzyme
MVLINTPWQYCNLQVLRLENEWVSVDILPELGGKIYSLIHKASGRNLLWQNPRLSPEKVPYGSSFDDHWCGGWDELLPNDLPRNAPGGDLLPDHGEFWAQTAEWTVLRSSPQSGEVRLSLNGRVLPTRFEKTIILTASDPFVRIRYSFSNSGMDAFPFLWNIHPAMAISPDTWLDVPADRGITETWRGEQFQTNTQFQWPYANKRIGGVVDLRQVESAEANTADMHYLVDVHDGWYAVTDQAAQVGLALRFPRQVFPHIWLFRTFGGWRGLHTLILEASSGYPYDLDIAAEQGTCGVMPAHGSLEVEVLAIPYDGVQSVAVVREDGGIVPG